MLNQLLSLQIIGSQKNNLGDYCGTAVVPVIQYLEFMVVPHIRHAEVPEALLAHKTR